MQKRYSFGRRNKSMPRSKSRPRRRSRNRSKLELKKRHMTLYHNNKLQTGKVWVTISPSIIYISRDKGRSYWLLNKVRPHMTNNDNTMTIKVSGNKIVFKSQAQYNQAKLYLNL